MKDKATGSRRRPGVSSAQVRALMDAAVGHYQDIEPEQDSNSANHNEAKVIAPITSTSAPGKTDHLRREALEVQPERAQVLRARGAKIPVNVLREVREAVVGQIALTDFVSHAADQSNCSILYNYAAYVFTQDGHFDPDEHLTDRWIKHYLHDRRNELTTTSQATIQSALRRIRAGSPDKPGMKKRGRKVAQKPYTQEEWARLRRRVRNLVDERLRTDITMLLDLTGEVGLRSTEVLQATGRWIESVDGVTVIRVPDANGEFRDVPAFGLVAHRLAAHRHSHQYLFAPQVSDRRNAIAKIKQRAKAHAGLQDLNAMRARNHWLAEIVTLPIPSTVVWAVAGLKPGTHTVGDILLCTRQPSPEDIVRHLSDIRDHH